jgi:hypothetical protein
MNWHWPFAPQDQPPKLFCGQIEQSVSFAHDGGQVVPASVPASDGAGWVQWMSEKTPGPGLQAPIDGAQVHEPA